MQVEMVTNIMTTHAHNCMMLTISYCTSTSQVQIFGNSMEHTPWYRFPFWNYLKLYFSVLFKEVSIVTRKHGITKGLFSNAFLVDLVPGFVMLGLFGQLQLLATPLLLTQGHYYEEESMIEEVVVLTGDSAEGNGQTRDEQWWKHVDDSIIRSRHIMQDLYVLTVPTFKQLTTVLRSMSYKLRSGRVLEISNQGQVQMKVKYHRSTVCVGDSSKQQDALPSVLNDKIPTGCEAMFSYRHPQVGERTDKIVFVSLCVDVPQLLTAIHVLESNGVEIVQIYDFWH